MKGDVRKGRKKLSTSKPKYHVITSPPNCPRHSWCEPPLFQNKSSVHTICNFENTCVNRKQKLVNYLIFNVVSFTFSQHYNPMQEHLTVCFLFNRVFITIFNLHCGSACPDVSCVETMRKYVYRQNSLCSCRRESVLKKLFLVQLKCLYWACRLGLALTSSYVFITYCFF